MATEMTAQEVAVEALWAHQDEERFTDQPDNPEGWARVVLAALAEDGLSVVRCDCPVEKAASALADSRRP